MVDGDHTELRDRLTAELEQLDDRRNELAQMWARGNMSPADWAAGGRALDAEEHALRSQLADVPTPVESLDPVVDGQGWATMTLAERSEFVRLFVGSVEVQPATRRGPVFDPDRITIRWRRIDQ
ncbi:MAG: hypothetical protein S0880_09925 [Actinomycetota bacterium]|nr:hypothetical protein [Actinomycetota bacterium]